MLARRLRRRPNIEPALVNYLTYVKARQRFVIISVRWTLTMLTRHCKALYLPQVRYLSQSTLHAHSIIN